MFWNGDISSRSLSPVTRQSAAPISAVSSSLSSVVCLMPTKDHPNRITAHTAAAIMFEIVSLVADRFRNWRSLVRAVKFLTRSTPCLPCLRHRTECTAASRLQGWSLQTLAHRSLPVSRSEEH